MPITTKLPIAEVPEFSDSDRARLKHLEAIIEKGIGTFVDVGQSLCEVRDDRLYLMEGFTTFSDYLRGKWALGKTYAYQLIASSQVATNLSAAADMMRPCEIQPVHERQVRPLSILNPAQQCEIWEEAVRSADGKTITYKQVKALVDELVGPVAPTPPKERDPHAHSDALAFATMAILQLERIRDDDPLRYEGVDRVLRWIENKLTSWQPNKKQGAKRRTQCQEFLKRTTMASSCNQNLTEK